MAPDPKDPKASVPISAGAHTRVIILNGKSIFWTDNEISYEQILEQLYVRHPSRRHERLLTVTYRSDSASGELTPGEKVLVGSRTVIDAIHTGDA